MNALSRITAFELLFLTTLLFGAFFTPTIITSDSYGLISDAPWNTAQDDYGPDIFEWAIDGNVGTGTTVTVWANVSGAAPGLLNVSLVVITDHVETSKTLMASNGTYYTLNTVIFNDIHYYKAWIEAFDVSLNSTVSNYQVFNLYDDDLRPEIQAWGIAGSLINDATYTVWANISDSNSGVLNVSVYVKTDSVITAVELLTFTDSQYRIDMPQVSVNHTYTIWIETFDNALNFADSYEESFDFSFENLNVTDPSVSAPIVVSASLAMFACVVGVAFVKHRRDERLKADPPTEVVEDTPDAADEEAPRPHLLDELERDR
ncbi:MAG: hypothetical protein ACTSV2_10810 [Candidatus Thorarchaeota archaeon]